MRRICWLLLLLFVFAIPWEYSLDLGEPLGNIARVAGLLLLLAAIPAVLQSGRLRAPGLMQWLVLALFIWFCCSYFWSIEPLLTLDKMRSFFQEMMIVWLLWEFAGSADDLRALLRATVAGSWVLAVLTLASFASAEAIASDQIRFAANGMDPNDLARYLDLAFPLAALLANSERRWYWRLLAIGYLPLGFAAVLLTASREGFLAAVLALAGSGILLTAGHPRRLLAGALALPPAIAVLWFAVPHATLQRIATIAEQLQHGDLNQRLNIWHAGWHAFARAPFFGTGAGSFVSAAGLAPIDTAHNTALAIAVSGGLAGLFLATAILAAAIWSIAQTRGPLRWALGTALLVWMIITLVATVEESRTTWLLMALIALAARLAAEDRERLDVCFPAAETPSAISVNL
ncbi:MAG: O-antigen ligase family protein [Terracidiphilus sp.]|jgi:O-antigen ligase